MILLSDGKLLQEKDGKLTPMESAILKKYIEVTKENARRKEWKNSGEGAKFTGAYHPGVDATRAAESVSARVLDVARWGSSTLYTMMINGRSGVYQRFDDAVEEGVFLSDNEYRYRQLAPDGDKLLLTAEAAGECHLALVQGEGSRTCEFLTEGSCYESDPSWSRRLRDVIYYSSVGLEEIVSDGEDHTPVADEMSLPDMMREMRYQQAVVRRRGPAVICRMDLVDATVEEILADEKYNFTHPIEARDGSLYFIRSPYRLEERGGGVLTVLKDVVLFPIRLIRALFGFFDFFTMKYSGKTLNHAGGKAKTKPENQRFVDGNLIDAEKELQKNRESGEEFPGYVPRTHELCRLVDSRTEVLKKGVLAYELCREGIVISNGSYLLLLHHDGREEKLCQAEHVSRMISR